MHPSIARRRVRPPGMDRQFTEVRRTFGYQDGPSFSGSDGLLDEKHAHNSHILDAPFNEIDEPKTHLNFTLKVQKTHLVTHFGKMTVQDAYMVQSFDEPFGDIDGHVRD